MSSKSKEKCSFPGCNSSSRGQTLFSIETLKFCEKHFKPSQILILGGCKKLMEGAYPRNFQIDQNYCRLCMKILKSDRDKNLINDTLINLYEELTGMKLEYNEFLPDIHCKACPDEILNSLTIKRKFIETQETFNKLLRIKRLEAETESRQNLSETEDFPEIKEEFEMNINNDSNSNSNENFEGIFLNLNQFPVNLNEVKVKDEETKVAAHQESQIIEIENIQKSTKPTDNARKRKLAVKSDSTQQKIKCDYCNREIGKKFYDMHMKQIHKLASKYECDLCGCKIFLKSRLRLHMNNKHISRAHRTRFPCTYRDCNKSYLQKYALGQHILHDHLKKSNIVCEICGFQAKSNSVLKDHIRLRHTFETPFACEVKGCNAKFKTISALCDHRYVKHPQRTFACTICKLEFSKRSAMKAHRRKAHMEKTLICDFEDCNKAFYTQYLLQDHLDRIHYKLKKYECDLCKGRFSCLAHVNEHFRNIHIKPKFDCEVSGCGCFYARKDFLRNHIRTAHKDLEEVYLNKSLENVKNLKLPEIDKSIYTFTKLN